MPSSSLTLVSKSKVFPDQKSTLGNLKLSVSDLPMLSCNYIQKGCLFSTPPNLHVNLTLISLLKHSLSLTLSHFPPLAGQFTTDSDGYVYVTCNDSGVDFVHAKMNNLSIRDVLGPKYVPEFVREFFALDGTVSYDGHFKPIMAVQVTEIDDGFFIGCTVNHAVTDGTSFWNFFNTFAELTKGAKRITKVPDFSRDSVLVSPAILRLPVGGPSVTFSGDVPLRERIFSFSREAILQLKAKVNHQKTTYNAEFNAVEILGKQSNDTSVNDKEWFQKNVTQNNETDKKNPTAEISSFQSLCALLWRSVTRARKLQPSKPTTFRTAVNCRHRLEPKLEPFYFGNAIQSIPTYATAGDVLNHDLRWCAEQLNNNVTAHDNGTVRRLVEDWERNPRLFPLGNCDGASITMGSSPRFPMYGNDFGWGRPVAVRSGRANKFDGKISAFPGRKGGGTVDLEVVLAPETMAGIEDDLEFMEYVSTN